MIVLYVCLLFIGYDDGLLFVVVCWFVVGNYCHINHRHFFFIAQKRSSSTSDGPISQQECSTNRRNEQNIKANGDDEAFNGYGYEYGLMTTTTFWFVGRHLGGTTCTRGIYCISFLILVGVL
jgi:hypothetical protein